jgi:D-lactate dehydrogenase
VTLATRAGRRVLGDDDIPLYDGALPRGGRRRRPHPAPDAVAVYFPSCVGAMFGSGHGGEGVRSALELLCERAGVTLRIPDDIAGMCCGTPWKSKGYLDGYARMADLVLPALTVASRDGDLPIICDAASCTEGLETMRSTAKALGYSRLRFVDAVEFVHDELLDQLVVTDPVESLTLHHTCSTAALGITTQLTAVAQRVSRELVVPIDEGCCAFAGDRGMLHPELTASATTAEAAEVATRITTAYASANRTCEIGMTRATGRPYQHILEVVERATRPR